MTAAGPRLAFFVVLAALSMPLEAQPAGKVARIGYLSLHSAEGFNVEAFRRSLTELGWTEGGNLIIDYRSAEGKADRLPRLASEIANLKVRVIVAAATVPALAAKQATQTIPIVFTHVSDPVGSGLVPSLARPGGNITGFTHLNAGLTPKRMEFLRQALPGVSRVAAVWQPGGLGPLTEKEMLKETEDAARALGVQIEFLPVRRMQDLDSTLAAVDRDRVQALVVLPSPTFRNDPQLIPELAAKHRLPAVYFAREFAVAGGLMAYGADMDAIARGAAVYVDKILKGAKPSDLPVARASRFEFVINLRTAKSLGLTIPPALYMQADQVIQ